MMNQRPPAGGPRSPSMPNPRQQQRPAMPQQAQAPQQSGFPGRGQGVAGGFPGQGQMQRHPQMQQMAQHSQPMQPPMQPQMPSVPQQMPNGMQAPMGGGFPTQQQRMAHQWQNSNMPREVFNQRIDNMPQPPQMPSVPQQMPGGMQAAPPPDMARERAMGRLQNANLPPEILQRLMSQYGGGNP